MTKYSDFNNRIKVHKETRCQLFKSKQNFSKVFKMRHTYNNNSMDFCLLLYKLKLNQHKPRWGISLVTSVYSFCGAVRTREEEDAETLSVFFGKNLKMWWENYYGFTIMTALFVCTCLAWCGIWFICTFQVKLKQCALFVLNLQMSFLEQKNKEIKNPPFW